MLKLLAACLLAIPLMADWKVTIDKKPNEITGIKNAYAEVNAKSLASHLLIGCTDGKAVMRIREGFYPFRLTGSEGAYFSHVKLRPSMASGYIDVDAPLGRNGSVVFLVLDDRLVELLPKMKADDALLAQLSYNGRDQIVRFPMAGLDGALAKMAEAGCRF